MPLKSVWDRRVGVRHRAGARTFHPQTLARWGRRGLDSKAINKDFARSFVCHADIVLPNRL